MSIRCSNIVMPWQGHTKQTCPLLLRARCSILTHTCAKFCDVVSQVYWHFTEVSLYRIQELACGILWDELSFPCGSKSISDFYLITIYSWFFFFPSLQVPCSCLSIPAVDHQCELLLITGLLLMLLDRWGCVWWLIDPLWNVEGCWTNLMGMMHYW